TWVERAVSPGVEWPANSCAVRRSTPPPAQGRDVTAPQSMEVSVEGTIWSVNDVGDTCHLQIEPKHLCRFRTPGTRPDRRARRLASEIRLEQNGHVSGQGLNLPTPALITAERKRDGRDVTIQSEHRWRQTGQSSSAEARPAGREVEVEAVLTGQATKG